MSTDLADKVSRILDRAKHEALALLHAENEERESQKDRTHPSGTSLAPIDEQTQEKIGQYQLIAHKPYLTRKEAAIYLDVSERSISEWSARPLEQNPFPESRAGGDPRYKREKIDEWAARETERRRLKLAS